MNVSRIEIAEWLAKVADDELSGRALLKHKDGAASTVCFLSHQMIEKCLKVICILEHIELRKVHDLLELTSLLLPKHPGLQKLQPELELINRYYVGTRYPADLDEYTWQEAEKAFAVALHIKEYVDSLI